MPAKYRLSGEEIKNLPHGGGPNVQKRYHGKFFSLLAARIDSPTAKCAVVVSKKVSTKSVDRNKVKRRARSLIAKRIPSVKGSIALVFYAKKEARSAPFAEIAHDMDALFSKVEAR